MGSLAARRLAAVRSGHPVIRLLKAGLGALPLAEVPGLPGGCPGLLAGDTLAEGLTTVGDAHPALAAAEMIDGCDLGRAVAANFRMALALYTDHGAWAVGLEDLEEDQRRDAALRLSLVALLAWRLFSGTPEARARALLAAEAGRALLAWLAAVDLALAFAMEDEPLEADLLPAVLGDRADDAFAALGRHADRAELQGARAVLTALRAPLAGLVEACAARVGRLAAALEASLPALADHTAAAMAAEVEALPAALVLSARLMIETGAATDSAAKGPRVPRAVLADPDPEEDTEEPPVQPRAPSRPAARLTAPAPRAVTESTFEELDFTFEEEGAPSAEEPQPAGEELDVGFGEEPPAGPIAARDPERRDRLEADLEGRRAEARRLIAEERAHGARRAKAAARLEALAAARPQRAAPERERDLTARIAAARSAATARATERAARADQVGARIVAAARGQAAAEDALVAARAPRARWDRPRRSRGEPRPGTRRRHDGRRRAAVRPRRARAAGAGADSRMRRGSRHAPRRARGSRRPLAGAR